MDEEPECCQHAEAFGPKRAGGATGGWSAAFPEYGGGRSDAPSEGPAIGGTAVVGDVERSGRRLFEVDFECVWVTGSLDVREKGGLPWFKLSDVGGECFGCVDLVPVGSLAEEAGGGGSVDSSLARC